VTPKLVQISPERAGNRNLIAFDEEGEVWRGDIKRDGIGREEYIEWRPHPLGIREVALDARPTPRARAS
jgi:hypothetical protein